MILFDPSKYEIDNYKIVINDNPKELLERVQAAIQEDGFIPLGGCVGYGPTSFMQTLIHLKKIK